MIDTDKYKGHTKGDNEVGWRINNNFVSNGKCPNDRFIAYVQPNEDGDKVIEFSNADANLIADAPLLLAEVKRLREDYEKMSEVLRQHGMDICRHCRVIYRDDDMNHPHYPSLHPWHMDGMCMKETIE